MSEALEGQTSPEQRVFGDSFSFETGKSDRGDLDEFFDERVRSIIDGDTVWLPRNLDADHGVCADLYSNGKIVASLDFEYGTNSATVYTTSEGGDYGDTILCDEVSFNEAVIRAELLNIEKHRQLMVGMLEDMRDCWQQSANFEIKQLKTSFILAIGSFSFAGVGVGVMLRGNLVEGVIATGAGVSLATPFFKRGIDAAKDLAKASAQEAIIESELNRYNFDQT